MIRRFFVMNVIVASAFLIFAFLRAAEEFGGLLGFAGALVVVLIGLWIGGEPKDGRAAIRAALWGWPPDNPNPPPTPPHREAGRKFRVDEHPPNCRCSACRYLQ